MEDKRVRIIQWTALLGCTITAAQIAVILLKGEGFCLNQGCRIVENLTTIPSIFFNLAGLIYFLMIFAAARPAHGKPRPGFDWLSILLLAGLAAEGVLIGYQLIVARTFCSYCLIILALVVLLNILRGKKQLLTGSAILLSILAVAGSLNFEASRIMIQAQNLREGTFAVKSCDYPAAELHLFFSSDCPHCLNVLEAMAGDNNCEINFNPIDRLESLDLAELTYFPGYNPAINRLLLSLLDIKTIPVLMAVKESGPALIKGERAIIDYINEVCFAAAIDPYTGTSDFGEPAIGFSPDPGAEGECEIEVECPDDLPELPAPPGEY